MSELMNHSACQHNYDLNHYTRDDQGFYVDCIQCGETLFIAADTSDDFYNKLDLDDDNNDHTNEEED